MPFLPWAVASGAPADWLNVRTQFGAAGNGTTNDTAAVQAALNAVPAGLGGTVYFPPGNYLIPNGGLVPVSNTSIRGIGRTASFGSQITLGSAAVNPLFSCSGVTGLQFEGLDLVSQGFTGGTCLDASSGGANYALIQGNWFAGFARAVNFDSAITTFQVWILNNYINKVQNTAGSAGIAMRNVQSPIISQNFIQGNSTTDANNRGIFTPTGGGSCQYALIADNNLGQIGSGIYITDTGISDSTINGNQVTGCGQQGIYLHNLQGCAVVNNTVTDVSLAGTFHAYEITCGGTNAPSVVTSNVYENAFSTAHADYAFFLNSTSYRILFQNNIYAPSSVTTGFLSVQSGTIFNDTPAAITVGASPFAYVNNDGQNETVWIVGGTVSSVVLNRNGTNVTLPTSGPVPTSPSDTVTVTYTVAPTMTKVTF